MIGLAIRDAQHGTSYEDFTAAVNAAISGFERNDLVSLLQSGAIRRSHYVRLLEILFHQTYFGPYTFAVAAVRCPYSHVDAKEYLLRHAQEEMTHWRWLKNDLRALGACLEHLEEAEPYASCAAYVGYNRHVAELFPLGRLAIAAVLEGLSARFGRTYGIHLMQRLELKSEHLSFFLSHSQTDEVHSLELSEVLTKLHLSSAEWRRMSEVARNAGILYTKMYDDAAHVGGAE